MMPLGTAYYVAAACAVVALVLGVLFVVTS